MQEPVTYRVNRILNIQLPQYKMGYSTYPKLKQSSKGQTFSQIMQDLKKGDSCITSEKRDR